MSIKKHINIILLAIITIKLGVSINSEFLGVYQQNDINFGDFKLMTSFETGINGFESQRIGFIPSDINFGIGGSVKTGENTNVGYMHWCSHGIDKKKNDSVTRHRFFMDVDL